MEELNPTLKLIIYIRQGLEQGTSIRTLVDLYMKENQCETSRLLAQWWFRAQRKQGFNQNKEKLIKSRYLLSLFRILEKGLDGAPILQSLNVLEQDLWVATNDEIDKYLVLMPFKLLVPLLLFQFPAIMMLILGPLLKQILNTL